MSQPLPPLNHLRAFQVIGKHLSVSRAAAELHVTPSAVSHQLQVLEDRLGQKLFVRHGRGLSFTELGRRLHASVDEAVRQLEEAFHRACGDHSRKLVVGAPQTFSTRELLPRLHRFTEQVGDTEIRIGQFERDLDREGIDCAIAYGDGRWPDLEVDFLADECLVLVCSPGLLGPGQRLDAVDDLGRHPLLQARPRPEDWPLWLNEAGQRFPARARVLTLHNRNLVIQAAEEGLGLAVVDRRMVTRELQTGRLVQPWDLAVRGLGSYYLVYPRVAQASPKVMAFRAWLLSEFAGTLDALRDVIALPGSRSP